MFNSVLNICSRFWASYFNRLEKVLRSQLGYGGGQAALVLREIFDSEVAGETLAYVDANGLAFSRLPELQEKTMKTLTAIVVCASVAMPLFAYAQAPADVAYCNQLSQTYRSTVMSNSTPDATVPVAMSKCATAPGEAIPTLEKALTDAKVTLPKRS